MIFFMRWGVSMQEPGKGCWEKKKRKSFDDTAWLVIFVFLAFNEDLQFGFGQ